jgi:hypothetical protein
MPPIGGPRGRLNLDEDFLVVKDPEYRQPEEGVAEGITQGGVLRRKPTSEDMVGESDADRDGMAI